MKLVYLLVITLSFSFHHPCKTKPSSASFPVLAAGDKTGFSMILNISGGQLFNCKSRFECAHQEHRSFSPQGSPYTHLSAASSPLSGQISHFTYKPPLRLPRSRHSTITPRASKDAAPFSFKFPPMEKKPRWYWRTLACLPYLMPLHETWMYAETAYHLHPFLESFEFLTYPFLSALGGLPSWFLIAYFIVAYLAVVRRKEWPHFFRFHVVSGMLLEIALQVTGTVWRWLPGAWYWGKAGMHFWTAFAFAFLFTVLECIRCCLVGMYADVPFVSDAAYIQIPYE